MSVSRKAIILSAGQGKRLLPFTAQRPKCLLPLGGRTVLEWQIAALAANGVEEVVVVTGFEAQAVETVIRARADDGILVRPLHNPFFEVADNIGSCFVARHEMMDGDFVLLNGDTLFHPSLFAEAKTQVDAPIVVTVDHKERYDSDDMKVQLDGRRLVAIGKTLTEEQSHAESIGMLFFSDDGGRIFADALEQTIRREGGLKRWYLSVIDELAGQATVHTANIQGREWCEVDFPKDLPAAERLGTRMWREQVGAPEDGAALCSRAP
ncbi:phosphocholine cytidylyltransferase family protein [Magnetospirillum aberrantis SpK]|uniref:Phosphocholine cytidylyltransferase family protein n=1 Tax=Magnetospirillum aberrantis SpK TaxID=908842 RepID=A0A7C9UWR1_9PROT|nr:phosphocholine cytidylyltransferase family protein [Magnetospirillum aberrantis]NFV81766.1 phosphocholine cytidylyltransferase family protein [Magnetospirillum aberrantis SpK]